MRKFLLLVGTQFLLMALTGCATCPSVLNNLTGSSFNIKGLNLTIPTSTPVPVKLGEFTFGPSEAQKISDSILAIDGYKAAQCTLMDQLTRLKPQPTARIETIAESIANANAKILDIANGLYNAPSKDAAVQKAVTSAEAMTKPASPAGPAGPSGPGAGGGVGGGEAYYLPPKEWYENNDQRLSNLMKLIKELKEEDEKVIDTRHSSTLALTGFAPGKSKLTKPMQEQLVAFFKRIYHASSSSSSELLNIALIGYTDTSGVYAKNIELGLSRAKSVADYLTQIDVLRPSRMRFIASGGVSNDFSEGRQVEIHVLSFSI